MQSSLPRFFAILALIAASALPAGAQQSSPFDMTPERGSEPAPVTPPATPVPETPVATPAQPAVPAPAPTSSDRYVIPLETLQLAGENARQGVGLYLTSEEAQAASTFHLGYLNAVVAAPEASELRVDINGKTILSVPISSSNETSNIEIPIPPGTLLAGGNLVEFYAVQRHRTDCSIASTYELWTRIDPARTFIRFDGADTGRVSRLGELAAIGFDSTGRTTVHVLAPGLDDAAARQAALGLVQTLGLALRMADITIDVTDTLPPTTEAGNLNVIMATVDALPPAADALREQARSAPLASLLGGEGGNTLVVSGPDWKGVETAIGQIGQELQPPPGMLLPRTDLPYPIPRVDGGTQLALSDLGLRTVEFNGRRYTTSFEFALPSDFYSNMFGQATLQLNAAYSSEVRPESQINIYVNGQIASSTPMLRTARGFARDTPINFPMTNFRAGRNRVDIEVLLQTDADLACPPGLTQSAPNRFVLSADSRLRIPDFARIAALPDLLAFAGTGAPYAGGEPEPVVIGPGAQSLSSAMTWLSRVAIAAGETVPVAIADGDSPDPAHNALVVSPLGEMSDGVAARSGIAQPAGDGRKAGSDDKLLDEFRSSSGGGSFLDPVRNWIANQFNLRPQDFWLLRPQDGAFIPQARDAVIVSQAVQPEGGIWTFLTIPDDGTFLDATRRLTRTENWRAISGRVSALGPKDPAVVAVQPNSVTLVQTQPPSFGNYRLVAANWLSTNILEFTLLLAALAVLLTLTTWALLKTIGRRG